MKSPLRSTRHPNWDMPMDHYDMELVLGIGRSGHLPEEGMLPRLIQGVVVYVKPKKNKFRPDGRRVKTSTHRVIAVCPECKRHIPFGRLAQHYKIHGRSE